MGFLDFFRKVPDEGKAGLPEDYYGSTGWETLYGSPSAWKDAHTVFKTLTVAELEAAYSIHPIVRACVNRIASTLSDPELELGQEVLVAGEEEHEWRPVGVHPLLELLHNGSRVYSGTDVLTYFGMRAMLTGFGYLQKIKNMKGTVFPIELWPLPSSMVNPIRAKTGGTLYSGFRVMGQDGIVPPEDMVIWRLLNPASTHSASPPLQSALHDYQLDMERQNYQAEAVTNLKIPGVAISTERGMSAEDKKEFKETYERKYGRGHRGAPYFLSGKGKIEVINPLGDMDWPGLTGLSETRICSAFGVPAIIIHSRAGLDASTYANYMHARKSFYVETMKPIWTQAADVLTFGLLRTAGEMRLKFRFRFDTLPEFQEDQDAKTERVVAKYDAGLITLNESRLELGMEPDPRPEGDEYKKKPTPQEGGRRAEDQDDKKKKKVGPQKVIA